MELIDERTGQAVRFRLFDGKLIIQSNCSSSDRIWNTIFEIDVKTGEVKATGAVTGSSTGLKQLPDKEL